MLKKGLAISFVVVFLALFVVSASFAEVILDGVWEEVGDASHIAVYVQHDNMIYVTGYYVSNGQPRRWYGNGQREGNNIAYSLTTLGDPNWPSGRTSKHTVKLSSDGRTLTGEWRATDGASGSFTMKKKSP
jgi:hypothetical protein